LQRFTARLFLRAKNKIGRIENGLPERRTGEKTIQLTSPDSEGYYHVLTILTSKRVLTNAE